MESLGCFDNAPAGSRGCLAQQGMRTEDIVIVIIKILSQCLLILVFSMFAKLLFVIIRVKLNTKDSSPKKDLCCWWKISKQQTTPNLLIKIAKTTRTSATTTAQSDIIEESGLHHGSKDLAAAAVETSGRRSRRRTRLNKLCLHAPPVPARNLFSSLENVSFHILDCLCAKISSCCLRSPRNLIKCTGAGRPRTK